MQVGGKKKAICLVLCNNSRSQLKCYTERHRDSKHLKMNVNEFSGIRIIGDLNSAFLFSGRGESLTNALNHLSLIAKYSWEHIGA